MKSLGASGRRWVFTYNNPLISATELESLLKSRNAIAYCFQLEKGESGTPHFQGCFTLKNASYMSVVGRMAPWHTEVCKDWEASLGYCSKPEGRESGPWLYGCTLPKAAVPKYTYKLPEPYRPWQKDLLDMLSTEPDDRSIYWYYDPQGHAGKTSLCKHVCSQYPDAIYVSGRAADIKAGIVLMSEKSVFPTIVLFGIVRSDELFVSYAGIESAKDGIFFSGKYESGMVMFKPPHVIIFSNNLPDKTKLSSDRWKIIHLSEPSPTWGGASSMPQ